jgi:hypothetical protein
MSHKLFIWVRWGLSTVIVGLLPIIIRLIAFYSPSNQQLDYCYTSSDIIIFGLILNISIVGEIFSIDLYESYTRIILGLISVIFIAIMAVLYSYSLSDKLNNIYVIPNVILVVCTIIINIFHINILTLKG